MPYELTVQGDHYFLRFVDAMTQADLERLPDEVKALEDSLPEDLDRITDITAVESFEIGFPDMHAIAARRRARTFRNPVRSALVVRDPVAVGFARMFQTLNDNPQIEIRIVPPLEAARAWIAEPRPARTE